MAKQKKLSAPAPQSVEQYQQAEQYQRELEQLVEQKNDEQKLWKDIEAAMQNQQLGTNIPALYSVFYKFIQNPSTVSVDTFKRMIDTDDTLGSGVDFLTTTLASRLGKYQHKSAEITEWVNARLDAIQGGWFNCVKEMLSASWAGYYVGEKVWSNTEHGFVIDRIVGLPQTSVLFEVNRAGQLEPDGILQYQRNINPFGLAQNFNFFGGVFNSGFSLSAPNIPWNDMKIDPFAKMGDLPYPIRNSNTFLYMTVRIPRDKCVHYAFDAQGKMGNPYGRSRLRRAFNAYVAKAQTLQMMLRALDRKGTPLMVVYSAPNATVRDPQKVAGAGGGNMKGRNVGTDAARSVSKAFANIHNDSVVVLPGKKDQIYSVDVIPMDAHADQFITTIQYFDRCMLRALLIPALVFSTGDGTGSYALGESHFKTFDKICDGDLEGLKQVIREQIIHPMLMYNFPQSAWYRDGIGDFTKRELSADERQKEAEMVEKAVNIGVCDLNDLADFNAAREKFGFEAKDSVPQSVEDAQAVVQEEDGAIEVNSDDEGVGDDETTPPPAKQSKEKKMGRRPYKKADLAAQVRLGSVALSGKGKLCSMFLFEGVDHPEVLHVTHKYFGKQADKLLPKVTDHLTEYFKQNPFTRFTPTFDRVEMFGDQDHVKVLTGPARERKLFHLDLKGQLDKMQPDKFADYLPHASVSDNVDELKLPITDYVLVHDGKIVFRASEVKGADGEDPSQRDGD